MNIISELLDNTDYDVRDVAALEDVMFRIEDLATAFEMDCVEEDIQEFINTMEPLEIAFRLANDWGLEFDLDQFSTI